MGSQSYEAYNRHIMGAVPTYQARHRDKLWCQDCREDMTAGSETAHRQLQHRLVGGGTEATGGLQGLLPADEGFSGMPS